VTAPPLKYTQFDGRGGMVLVVVVVVVVVVVHPVEGGDVFFYSHGGYATFCQFFAQE